jgi:hypothetical protein
MAAALALTTTAQASGRGRGTHPTPHPGHQQWQGHESRGYHEQHGTRFSHGYFYRGREHNHWTYRYYWSSYGCECFYCPSTYCWYYWYAPSACYYPVNYISYATPTRVEPPVFNTNTNTNTNNNNNNNINIDINKFQVTPTALAPEGAAPPAPPVAPGAPVGRP